MNQKSRPIMLSNFNQGGIADSDWSGIKDSLAEMVGLDVHSKPGLMRVRQKLTKMSGTDVDAFVKVQVACSNGKSYAFSSTTGKVWQIDESLALTLVYTIVPDKGDAGILGAAEYQDFLYIATQDRLHRIPITGLSDWNTNMQLNWASLNLEQPEIGGTGQTYTLGTSIVETATHRQTFTAYVSPLQSVAVNIGAKGTGNWTATIHNSANVALGSLTIVNASLAAGWNYFDFSSLLLPIVGDEYHVHFTSTVADGTVVTGTTVDLETGNMRFYTTSDSEWHPMIVLNGNLYIGDRHFVHVVEGQTFTNGSGAFSGGVGLDVNQPLRIKCFGVIKTDLLIGTFVNNNVNKTKIYRWNTFSVSYSSSDPIEEVGINAFLQSDNYVFVQAGQYGNIYLYNGEQLEIYKRLPGEYSPTKYGQIHPNAVGNMAGLILFGFSNGSGNPTEQGVYVLGRNSRNYPYIIDLSYPISERDGDNFVLGGIEIGSILVRGADALVSWKNGPTYGIDKIDYTALLDGAFFTSRVILLERDIIRTVAATMLAYASLPVSTSFEVSMNKNYDGFVSQTTVVDADRVIVKCEERLEVNTLQTKVTFRASANTAPELESVGIYLDV